MHMPGTLVFDIQVESLFAGMDARNGMCKIFPAPGTIRNGWFETKYLIKLINDMKGFSCTQVYRLKSEGSKPCFLRRS